MTLCGQAEHVYMRRCVKHPQQSPLGTGQSSRDPWSWVASLPKCQCLGWNHCQGPLSADSWIAQQYCDFLETVPQCLLDDVPLALRMSRQLFQHNKSPVHYGKDVQQCLNVPYPGKWIGHRRPNACLINCWIKLWCIFSCGDNSVSTFMQSFPWLSEISQQDF